MKVIQQSSKLEKHIQALEKRHNQLEFEVSMQLKEYGNDSSLQVLKKQKLLLKDEIELCKKQLETASLK